MKQRSIFLFFIGIHSIKKKNDYSMNVFVLHTFVTWENNKNNENNYDFF